MLARVSDCVCVCVNYVTRRHYVKTPVWIRIIYGRDFLWPDIHRVKTGFGYLQNKELFPGLRKIRQDSSPSSCAIKLEFHDADTDTDTDILARILADTPDTRDFLKLFLWQVERHTDTLATSLERMSARMSVSASWNASLNKRPRRPAVDSTWRRLRERGQVRSTDRHRCLLITLITELCE